MIKKAYILLDKCSGLDMLCSLLPLPWKLSFIVNFHTRTHARTQKQPTAMAGMWRELSSCFLMRPLHGYPSQTIPPELPTESHVCGRESHISHRLKSNLFNVHHWARFTSDPVSGCVLMELEKLTSHEPIGTEDTFSAALNASPLLFSSTAARLE